MELPWQEAPGMWRIQHLGPHQSRYSTQHPAPAILPSPFPAFGEHTCIESGWWGILRSPALIFFSGLKGWGRGGRRWWGQNKRHSSPVRQPKLRLISRDVVCTTYRWRVKESVGWRATPPEP